MRKGARPDSPALIAFHRVSKALRFGRASSAYRFGCLDCDFADLGIAVILGPKNRWDILAFNTAGSFDRGFQLFVRAAVS